MLEFLKSYYVLLLSVMVLSFLVPKEEYKLYLQYFTGIFLVVMLLHPFLEIFVEDNWQYALEVFDIFQVQVEPMDADVEKGATIFDYLKMERNGK